MFYGVLSFYTRNFSSRQGQKGELSLHDLLLPARKHTQACIYSSTGRVISPLVTVVKDARVHALCRLPVALSDSSTKSLQQMQCSAALLDAL